MASRQEEGCYEKKHPRTFSCLERSIERWRRGANKGHRVSGDTTGRALVSKPAISLKNS